MKRGTFLKNYSNLSHILSTSISCRLCLNTAKSSSVWKTNNKCLSRRPWLEAYLYHKFCHRKRKNCKKRQQRWQMPTVGSSFLTHRCPNRRLRTISRSFNSSRRLSRTSDQISTSSRHWRSFLRRSWKRHLTHRSWWNLKKKSTDYSGQMHSISPSANSTKTLSNVSILNWKRSRFQQSPRRTTYPTRFKWGSYSVKKYHEMLDAWSSNAISQRFVRFIKKWTLALLWTVALPWSVWSSLALRTKSALLSRSRRKKRLRELQPRCMCAERNLKRWLRRRPEREMPITGTFEWAQQNRSAFMSRNWLAMALKREWIKQNIYIYTWKRKLDIDK